MLKNLALPAFAVALTALVATTASANCYGCNNNSQNSGWFNAGVLGQNQTLAQGDQTMTGSLLVKTEQGEAYSFNNMPGRDGAGASALVSVMGSGMAAAVSAGPGSSMSGTAVMGVIEGFAATGVHR